MSFSPRTAVSPIEPVKARLAGGQRLLGVLLRMPAEELVEMAAVSGFDFVLIDCEHGPADVTALRHHIVLAETHGMAALVRVGSDEAALVLRALDQGAQGIVAPHIDTAEDAAALVASVHYPPLGHRGFATYSRVGRFGLVDPEQHRERYLSDTLVIGMIESPLGVSNAAVIVAVPGLDGVMIGTADLGASSTADDPAPADAVREVNRVLAEADSVRMDIVGDLQRASAAFADGAQLVVYNLAAVLMAQLAQLRSARP